MTINPCKLASSQLQKRLRLTNHGHYSYSVPKRKVPSLAKILHTKGRWDNSIEALFVLQNYEMKLPLVSLIIRKTKGMRWS